MKNGVIFLTLFHLQNGNLFGNKDDSEKLSIKTVM